MCIWNSRWPPLQNYFKIILLWNPSDIQYGHHHMASQVPYKVFFLMCIWNSRWPPLQNYFKIILLWNPSDIQYGHHHMASQSPGWWVYIHFCSKTSLLLNITRFLLARQCHRTIYVFWFQSITECVVMTHVLSYVWFIWPCFLRPWSCPSDYLYISVLYG